jgi:hypothetical protein
VKIQEPFKVEFHSDAATRFSQLAQEVLKCVHSFERVDTPPTRGAEIHPVASLTADDIIGEVMVQESSFNGLGEETGRYWNSKGLRVGWEGREFEAIKDLVLRFGNAAPIKNRVSSRFLLDEIFKWLRETLEAKRSDALPDYIAERCSSEIRDYEIWVPVYRTYSTGDFAIGDVEFRTVSKVLLDEWYAHVPEDVSNSPEVAHEISRKRARIQGSIAACVRVKAEVGKAREIAQSVANEAVGLLRFLSPVNWTCKLVSNCLPVGRENTLRAMELFVEDGAIMSTTDASVEQGPAGWNIDEARLTPPGLLEALHKLALHREGTEFRSNLYGALQLHSRHSIVAEIPHKIVFVAAAIESLLLKDPHEPIQKNLGERMALIVGDSLEERKEIVNNVEDFYRVRSALFHHGKSVSPEDTKVVDNFFFNVWFGLRRLLDQVDQYATKDHLLTALEDKKLS